MWQVVLWVALVAISSAAAKTAVATVFGQQHDWSDTEAGSVIIFMQAGLGALIIWPSMRHFTSLLVAAFAASMSASKYPASSTTFALMQPPRRP